MGLRRRYDDVDQEDRHAFFAQLKQARVDAGFTRIEFSRATGCTAAVAAALDHDGGPYEHLTSSVQRYAAGLGLYFRFEFHDLPSTPEGSVAAARLRLMAQQAGDGIIGDQLYRQEVQVRLRAARNALRLSMHAVAEALGSSHTIVCKMERKRAPDPYVVTVQRHARALGGRVSLHADPYPDTAG